MTALRALTAAYEDPGAAIREWHEVGGLVVGCVGADVPHELVAAAGMLPVRLRGEGEASPLAEAVLGPRVDPSVRLILAGLLERRPPIDFLLVSHESDSTVRLFTSLRVLARDEAPPPLPDLAIVDLLHLPTDTTAAYDLDRMRELAGLLERWSGRPLTEEGLRGAIAEANRTRRLLGQLTELRCSDPPRLSGADALAVLGAGTALPAARYNDLLEALLASPGPPLPPPARRLYLTGSHHTTTAVYRALEASTGVTSCNQAKLPNPAPAAASENDRLVTMQDVTPVVVGEDHGSGAPAGGLIDEDRDPIAALSAWYHAGAGHALRNDPDARAKRTAAEAVAARADLVLSWIRTGDDALAWGVPALKRELAANGIPLVVLEHRGLEAPAPADLAALR